MNTHDAETVYINMHVDRYAIILLVRIYNITDIYFLGNTKLLRWWFSISKLVFYMRVLYLL